MNKDARLEALRLEAHSSIGDSASMAFDDLFQTPRKLALPPAGKRKGTNRPGDKTKPGKALIDQHMSSSEREFLTPKKKENRFGLKPCINPAPQSSTPSRYETRAHEEMLRETKRNTYTNGYIHPSSSTLIGPYVDHAGGILERKASLASIYAKSRKKSGAPYPELRVARADLKKLNEDWRREFNVEERID